MTLRLESYYKRCVTCDETFDLWRMDSIKDSGHEGHLIKDVNPMTFISLVKQCKKDGCLDESYFDNETMIKADNLRHVLDIVEHLT